MKLRQQQLSKIELILSDLERKVEEMEQQDYMTFDLGKDLQNPLLFRSGGGYL